MEKSKRFAKKKHSGPSYRVFEGENQDFLSAVNEKLAQLPDVTETFRNSIIGIYGSLPFNLKYMSPVYFAGAIAFLNKFENGPTKQNLTDAAVEKYIGRNIPDNPGTVSASTIKLRRKIEFLRYIRLVNKLNEQLKIIQQTTGKRIQEALEAEEYED